VLPQQRSAPLASPRSGAGPLCSASASVRLSSLTRTQLAQLLRGERSGAVQVTALNASDPEAGRPGQGGSPGLFPLFWRARCVRACVQAGRSPCPPHPSLVRWGGWEWEALRWT